ncbi:MAG: topoisomerase DNA-binding C4 zinc finger domain-containing protein [Lachnospiraceae bacterium]|nr:topoisomerase DNA-binding C4 zinc finger domain-containing protein [Lachnospiraceae bacterium]
MLSNNPGKKLNMYVSDYVVFDLETTGIHPSVDKVIEISAIKVIGGLVDSEFSTLVNPGMHIPYGATYVNNITDQMVKDSPAFDVALKDFLEFVGDYVLVGHNIQLFDLKFLYRDAKDYFGLTIGNDYVDTLPLSKKYLPQLRHHTLLDLAGYYNITIKDAHRALGDCRMNQRVYESLRAEIENPSQAAKAVPVCPICGNILKKRNGKFGLFYGCSSYPSCTYTRNI